MTVAIAYIHPGMVHDAFLKSLIGMLWYDQAHRQLVMPTGQVIGLQCTYIPEARNDVVALFLEGSCEWLWFLDYDVVFPVNSLYRLLDSADSAERPIMGGVYFGVMTADNGDEIITPYFGVPDGTRVLGNLPRAWVTNQIVRATWTASGCLLIHRSVLEALDAARPGRAPKGKPAPWKWFGHDPDPDDPDFTLGEDLTFCARAAALGFPTHVNTGVLGVHTGKWRSITVEDYASQSWVNGPPSQSHNGLVITDRMPLIRQM